MNPQSKYSIVNRYSLLCCRHSEIGLLYLYNKRSSGAFPKAVAEQRGYSQSNNDIRKLSSIQLRHKASQKRGHIDQRHSLIGQMDTFLAIKNLLFAAIILLPKTFASDNFLRLSHSLPLFLWVKMCFACNNMLLISLEQ